jgi:hypothetical protein
MKKYRDVPWKRNVRKIPEHVQEWLNERNSPIVAGVTTTLTIADIAAGKYKHVGISIAAGRLLFKEAIVPSEEMGGYSRKNREGWEVRRDDLPMINRTFSVETPNYGDWANGSHTMEWQRECYQYDYFDAPFFAIRVQLLKGSDAAAVLNFVVDWPLSRDADDFNEDLLFALNLLQENLGQCGVLDADASHSELLASIDLSWEFFPPGTAADVERFFCGRSRAPSPDLEVIIRERTDLFVRLAPMRYLRGAGGMSRYIGAQFADDFVVFENVKYGNAIWALFEDWVKTSKRSRIDLLRLRDVPYQRIVHSEGWQERLVEFVRTEKKKRGITGAMPLKKKKA